MSVIFIKKWKNVNNIGEGEPEQAGHHRACQRQDGGQETGRHCSQETIQTNREGANTASNQWGRRKYSIQPIGK